MSPRKKASNRTVVPLPARHKEYRLPFAHIHADDFEYACQDLARNAFPELQPELKRRKGLKQFEVDIECFNKHQDPEVVIQSKCYAKVTPSEYVGWIDTFIGELNGHWKGKKVQRFVLAVTVEGNSDKLREKCKKAVKDLKSYGIEFEPWFLDKLTELVRGDPSFIDRYFNSAWKDAISVRTGPAEALSSPIIVDEAASMLVNLSTQVADAVNQIIDQLEQKAKSGNSSELKEYLEDFYFTKEKWDNTSPETRARILERLAIFALQVEDISLAEEYLEEARKFAPPKNQIAHARLTCLKDGLGAAIDLLADSQDQHEVELRASFLIAAGKRSKAFDILNELPESSERCRLKALAAIGEPDKSKAVDYAKKAVELNNSAYGNKLAYMFASFNAALINGIVPELALSPNPFNPIVVCSDNEAILALDQALITVEQLILTTECNISNQLKVWKLAILVSHAEKRLEAREYAFQILEEHDVSPVFIIWCLFLGMEFQYGKLRKRLEDRIRSGVGDETDVLATALLVQEKEGPGNKAGSVIDKYLARFPSAEQFLMDWKERVSGASELGLLADVANEFSDAFDELVDEALQTENDPAYILQVASVLAFRKAYEHLNRLREKLLKIRNARSVQLVVEGLIEGKDPDQALSILDENIDVFGSTKLPSRALQLRAIALDRIGKQGEAIHALELYDTEQPSLATKLNLLSRAVMLGDNERISRHGRGLLNLEDNAGSNYLLAAKDIRRTHPELSRDLVERYFSSNTPEPEIVPLLIDLSKEIDLSLFASHDQLGDIHRRFFAESDTVIRIESVEEFLAQLEKVNRERKEFRKGWLAGQMTSHEAFGWDPILFSKLYASRSEFIETDDGVLYPPLIRASGLEKVGISENDLHTLPKLVLDVSALVTAMQFELLDKVESCFEVSVPQIVPIWLRDTLDQFESRLRDVSGDDIALYDLFLQTYANQLDVIKEDNLVEAECVSRGGEELSPPPHPLATVLKFVELQGLMTSSEYQFLLSELRYSAPVSLSENIGEKVESLQVDGGVLLTFIRCHALDAITECTSISITHTHYEKLRKTIEKSREEYRIYKKLRELEARVKSRLQSDQWRTLAIYSDQYDGLEISNLPHTLASLHESLLCMERDSRSFIWVEDRFVGRHQFSNVITLDQILIFLRSKGRLSCNEYSNIQRMRFEAGHGFLDVSAKQIFVALKQTRYSGAGLYESADLLKYRKDFAQQVLHLPYLDWSENRTVDQNYIGDPRYVINLAKTAAKLQRLIWFDKDIDTTRKQVFGNWAWANFRIECFPRHGEIEQTADQYRANLAIVLALFLSWPITEKLENLEVEWSEYKEYLHWFSRTILMPKISIDEKLEDAFLEYFVGLLRPHLCNDGITPEDGIPIEKLQAIFEQQIANFLDLLPPKLKTKLLDYNSFADDLRIKLDHTITTENGVYTASDIAEALSVALGQKNNANDLVASLSTVNGDRNNLVVHADENAIIPNVYIDTSDEKAVLSRNTVAICLPTKQKRQRAFAVVEKELKTDDITKCEIRSAYIENMDVSERLRALHRAQSRDFSFSERHLRDQLESREEISEDELHLPSAVSLARYLRLDLASDKDISKKLAEGYSKLVSELGVEVADRRYAACPVSFEEAVQYKPERPLRGDSMFQFARGLRRASYPENAEKTTLGEDLNRFVEVVEMQQGFFNALIKRGALDAKVRKDWSELPPQLSVAFIWIWADRICGAFLSANLDLEAATEVISKKSLHYLPAILEPLRASNIEIAFGTQIEPISTIQLLLAHVDQSIADLENQELLERVSCLLGFYIDSKWYPHPRLLTQDPALKPECMKETLYITELVSRGFTPRFDELETFDQEKFIDDVISDAERKDTSEGTLIQLSACRMDELNQDQVERVLKVLQAYLGSFEGDVGDATLIISLRLFAEVSGLRGQTVQLKSVLKHLISCHFGRRCKISLPSIPATWGQGDESVFANVCDALFAHVRQRQLTFSDKATELLDLFMWMEQNWHGSGALLVNTSSNCIDGIPTDISQKSWAKFCQIRRKFR